MTSLSSGELRAAQAEATRVRRGTGGDPSTSGGPRTDLRARLEAEFPPAVVLKEGEAFVGRYVRLEQGHAEYRGLAWVAIFVTDEGEERALWLLHQALLNSLKRVRPRPGEWLAVKCLGKRKSQAGASYVDYRIVIDRSADWDDVAIEDAEP